MLPGRYEPGRIEAGGVTVAEVRLAVRRLKRWPRLTGLTAASLALAIGGNAAPVFVHGRAEAESYPEPAANYDAGEIPTAADEAGPTALRRGLGGLVELGVTTASAPPAPVSGAPPTGRTVSEGAHPSHLARYIRGAKTPEEKVRRRSWVETKNQDPVTAWTNLTKAEALIAPITGNKAVDDRLKEYALSKHGAGAEGLKSIIPFAVNSLVPGGGAQRAASVLSALTDAHAKGIATDVREATRSWQDFSEFVRYSFGHTLPSMAMAMAGGAVSGAAAGSFIPGIGTLGGAVAGGIGAAAVVIPLSVQKLEEDAASRLGYRSPNRGRIYGGGLGAAALVAILLGAPAGWAVTRAIRPATERGSGASRRPFHPAPLLGHRHDRERNGA